MHPTILTLHFKGNGLSRPIDVAAMLGAMDENDPSRVVNLVDDSKVAASGREQAVKLTSQRLSRSMRVGGDRSEDCFKNGDTNLVGKLIDAPKPLGGDLDVERTSQI